MSQFNRNLLARAYKNEKHTFMCKMFYDNVGKIQFLAKIAEEKELIA